MSFSKYVFGAVVLHLLRWLFIFFFVSTMIAVLLYRWLPVPLTPLMVIRCVQQVEDGRVMRLRHHWVPLEQMSKYLPVAVIASEDQNFLSHNGFDFKAVKAAYLEHKAGGRRRGGSTISQQTAKNVFLWPASSWVRKGFEVYFTALIELCWSKERIMEVYLNSIELGEGIYGAEAVAQLHFGTTAAELTRAQCALIAATLPNPLRYDSAHPSRYMLKRQRKIMSEMRHIPLFHYPEEAKAYWPSSVFAPKWSGRRSAAFSMQ